MFTDFTDMPRAGAAIETLQKMSVDRPIPNIFLERLRAGTLPQTAIPGLVGVTHKCHPAEITGFAAVLARFPRQHNTEFLANMIHLINRAGPKLSKVCAAMRLDAPTLQYWPEDPRAWQVAAFWGRMGWLGNASETGIALYWDMVKYFPDSDEMLALLPESGLAVPAEFVGYYAGGQSDELERQALLAAEEGFDAGEDPQRAIVAGRQMDEAIGGYWAAAAEAAESG
ncbi:hypothetical protein D5S18_26345 [Nocardia panacis]|uniref:Uncharacterized protein n=1 Tax=Nocardia panacis TaxID=2340916 RepID=A0A3A4KMF9_9NOCA|nr:hypothetical protein [Nocardia panacis]RJO70726.1 hypothetical protein D5S18_26345 [Nocardia panacis]